ncbi:MAG: nucleotidyltransferase domain-containing protein [Nitrospinota bacterium]|jgi:predicted nucleotidyltransferase
MVRNISEQKRYIELQAELSRWIEILKREYDPESIILFGSFAQEKVKRWSDIDLVIIKRTEKSFLDRIKEVLLILHPKVGLDVLVYTPEEFKNLCSNRAFFKSEIGAKGVKIYERGS